MFSGKYFHTIDEKNRLAIPSRILEKIDRKKDGKGFWIARGLDGCLFMYTQNAWQNVVSKLEQKLSFTQKKARDFQRLFFSTAYEIPDCDQQGRILIPQDMKELAQIQKNVVVVGLINRIEIWDDIKWKENHSKIGSSFEELAEVFGV